MLSYILRFSPKQFRQKLLARVIYKFLLTPACDHERQIEFVGKLGQPVFPYAANNYAAFVSVVQNVAMAATIYPLLAEFWPTAIGATKPALSSGELYARTIIALFIVAVIWHRYFSHIPFIAWLPGWVDVLVLIVYSVTEYAMVLNLVSENPRNFFLGIIATALWAIFAYGRVYYAFRKGIASAAYEYHFKAYAPVMLIVMREFHVLCLALITALAAFLIGVFYLLGSFTGFASVIKEVIKENIAVEPMTAGMGMACFVVIFALFKFDLRWWLSRQMFIATLQKKASC